MPIKTAGGGGKQNHEKTEKTKRAASRTMGRCADVGMRRLAHLAELEVLGLDGLLDQMVLLWPHLDRRGGGGGGGRLLQAVQHLPDVELLHFSQRRIKGGGGWVGGHFFSLRGTHTHSGALSVLWFWAHMLARLPRRSLHRWEAVTRVSLDVQGSTEGSWDVRGGEAV